LLVTTKLDLLPYVAFDLDAAVERARQVRPGVRVVRLSAGTGRRLSSWIAWLLDISHRDREPSPTTPEQL
jgi:hydrogenase nickel incorporation protein HypB